MPKTETIFVQRALAKARSQLETQGLLYPGDRGDHLREAQDVLGRQLAGDVNDEVAGSWEALVREVDQWPGAALISHEVFAAATTDQVRTVLGAFPDRRPEVIVTGQDLARQLTANWQQRVEHGQSQTLSEYVDDARGAYTREDWTSRSSPSWSWQDLVSVLRTWSEVVPADQLHVVTVPPRGSAPTLLWDRFTDVLGVQLGLEDVKDRSVDVSLGRAETEFLRRLNAELADTVDRADYHTFVTQFLAGRALRRFRQSGPILLSARDQAWAAALSEQIARAVGEMSLQVHGKLDDLVSTGLSSESAPVSDAEVARVGERAIAQMLRRIGREQAERVQTGTTS
jgi:hypothetical protein